MMNEKELGVLLGTTYTDFLVFESTNLLCKFFMYGWSKQLVQVALSVMTTAAGPYVTSADHADHRTCRKPSRRMR